MDDFAEGLLHIVGIWVLIVLFLTCPLWGIPFVIYEMIKATRK